MTAILDNIASADGRCPIRLYTPEGRGPWPAVVMLPDAGGVRPTFFDMAARLAGLGYVTLLPDTYYRQGDWAPFDVEGAFNDGDERRRMMSFSASVTADNWACDATAFFDYLAARHEVRGNRFGVTGYCVGGRGALSIAGLVPDRVAAAASFHGAGLVTDDRDSPHLRAASIQAAVYIGGAEKDASFTDAHCQQLATALRAAGVRHTIEKYAAAHGYAVPDLLSYDAAAAARHWTATQRFLASGLA